MSHKSNQLSTSQVTKDLEQLKYSEKDFAQLDQEIIETKDNIDLSQRTPFELASSIASGSKDKNNFKNKIINALNSLENKKGTKNEINQKIEE